MLSINDTFSSIIGKNKIRLAVIGATSSGKTYLLTDLVSSLYRMGYYPKDNNQASPHSSITTFIPNVNEQDGIEKTPVYACRPENQYSSTMSNEQLGRSFDLDFLDVPGEVITKDSIMEFQAIAKALRNCGSKLYMVSTWRQRGGKGIKYTVKCITASHTIDSDDEQYQKHNAGIQLDGGNEITTTESLFGTTSRGISRTKEYTSSALYIDGLSRSYEKLVKKDKLISGKELFNNFYQYVTDTVMEAIVDSWEDLEIDKYLVGKLSAADSSFGLSPTDSNKDRFDKVYKNHFYFHYYTMAASDVVICDKMAVPAYVAEGRTTDKFNAMIQSLKTLAYMNEASKKHWYMAFRGVDSIIKQNYLQSFYENTDLNTTYSYFMMMLSRKISNSENVIKGPFGGGPKKNFSFADAYEMWEHLSGLEISEQVSNVAFDHYNDFETNEGEYFRDDNEFVVLSETSDDIHSQLREHILNRRSAFMGLIKVTTLPDEDNARMLQIPPHIYFTASPIDTHFNIYDHEENNGTKFRGPVSDPGQRICFGTYQLVCDILLAHGKSLPYEATEYGSILDYLFGND